LGKFTPFGQIYSLWAIVYFGNMFENRRSRPNFWATFSTVLVIDKIVSWGTFWAIVSQIWYI
jgi:hypothetical protein